MRVTAWYIAAFGLTISRAFLDESDYNLGSSVSYIAYFRQGGLETMFDSLDDTIKHDEERETTSKERWLVRLTAVVVGVVVLAGLYFGVQMLE